MKKGGCLKIVLGALLGLVGVIVILGIVVAILAPGIKYGVAQYLTLEDGKAEAIDTILSDCDITDITSITPDVTLDNAHFEGETGYRINTAQVHSDAGIVMYLDGEQNVYSIKYAGTDLYIDGTVQAKLSDFVMTNKEELELQNIAQETVISTLKSPSTAKFPLIDQWGFEKNKDTIKVWSYVDAQNSFGATSRSEFVITYNRGNKAVTSFIFDGKEYVQ